MAIYRCFHVRCSMLWMCARRLASSGCLVTLSAPCRGLRQVMSVGHCRSVFPRSSTLRLPRRRSRRAGPKHREPPTPRRARAGASLAPIAGGSGAGSVARGLRCSRPAAHRSGSRRRRRGLPRRGAPDVPRPPISCPTWIRCRGQVSGPYCATTSGPLGRSEKSVRTTHASVVVVRFG